MLVAVRPLGLYMAAVFEGRRTLPLAASLGPVERGFYRLAGVAPDKEQGWLAYTLAMLAFSALGFASLYAILRLQACLPLNPQGFAGVPPDLAFNTAVSFVTNTNWQAYGGETTMSHFSPDGRAHRAELPVGRDRHRPGAGGDPRLRAQRARRRSAISGSI